jgi:hypothetical protein
MFPVCAFCILSQGLSHSEATFFRELWKVWREIREKGGAVNLVWGAGYAIVGAILLIWAAPLSVRYNAWTTGVRERHPNVNPPPTPEWRARNTKIMTILFRVAGLFFLLVAASYFWSKAH